MSELSIFESKAKIFRLSKKNPSYRVVSEDYGKNLDVLRQDEQFIFHAYTKNDDRYFNLISSKTPDLYSFDAIILAQAVDVGLLVTEDKEILNLRGKTAFADVPVLNELEIKRWKDI